jgi:hypothetical protein|tara:strand:- start:99 stop:254 length:156 start_codon:yes stop_codon:yes gene_type:complete
MNKNKDVEKGFLSNWFDKNVTKKVAKKTKYGSTKLKQADVIGDILGTKKKK